MSSGGSLSHSGTKVSRLVEHMATRSEKIASGLLRVIVSRIIPISNSIN